MLPVQGHVLCKGTSPAIGTCTATLLLCQRSINAEYSFPLLRCGRRVTRASGIDLGALGIELPEIDNDVESYQRQLGASFDVSNNSKQCSQLNMLPGSCLPSVDATCREV
jgi:hypothetical protein